MTEQPKVKEFIGKSYDMEEVTPEEREKIDRAATEIEEIVTNSQWRDLSRILGRMSVIGRQKLLSNLEMLKQEMLEKDPEDWNGMPQ